MLDFSKVAPSRSWKFLPKKETGGKHDFHKFLYWVKSSGNVTESCRLSACNFIKNELLHRYFLRVLTANFRTPIFQNTSQCAVSAEAYSGLCQTSKIELLTIFMKSSVLDVSKGSVYTSVLKLQVLFIKRTSSKFFVTHFESIATYLMSFLQR